MPVLFRTSPLPVEHRAPRCSCAFALTFLCDVVKWLFPILISIFYILSYPPTAIHYEQPVFIPGQVLRAVVIGENSQKVYPGDDGFSIYHTASSNRRVISDAVYTINVDGIMPKEVQIAFEYTASFSKWVHSSLQQTGVFTFAVPGVFCELTVNGTLKLDQLSEPDFGADFEKNKKPKNKPQSIGEAAALDQEDQALLWIEWEEPSVYFFDLNSAIINLHIHIPQIQIIHNIPVSTMLRELLLIFLSSFAISSFAMKVLRDYCFHSHMLRTWTVPVYVPNKDE